MTEHLRICHLGKDGPSPDGGIATQVRTLAMAQAALDAQVRVYCITDDAGPAVVDHYGPVEVSRFGRTARNSGLVRAVQNVQADILHVHVPDTTAMLALLQARTKLPLVLSYHDDVTRQQLRDALFRPLEQWLFRRARAILTSSPLEPGASWFLRSYRDRVHVLPDGIDLTPYLEPSEEHETEAERIRDRYLGPLWLGSGRMAHSKGLLNAVRALTRVRGTLLLLGNGPDRPLLEDEAERIGVTDRIAFLGDLPHDLDAVPYYLAADALWFASGTRREAFGSVQVQVQAMASGCPVLNAAIPHSGVPWISRHGETGLTVPADDPVALAEAANRLLFEHGLRDRLARAARTRAVAEFDQRVMAKRSLAIYRHVLAEQANTHGTGQAVLATGS
jgi:rhamnosyl/mannosyltransferase